MTCTARGVEHIYIRNSSPVICLFYLLHATACHITQFRTPGATAVLCECFVSFSRVYVYSSTVH